MTDANQLPRVTVTGDNADRMHDLLNKFSGLYDRDGNTNRPQFRNQEMVDAIVAEVAQILSVTADDATTILLCEADNAFTDGDPHTFSYDPNLLPSANPS